MKKSHTFEVILVLFMAITAYGYFFSGTDWNTNSRLGMVKSIVEENRFEIDTYHKHILITNDKAKLRGHYYSDKAIGATLIGAEFYFPIYGIYHALGTQMNIDAFSQVIAFLVISLLCALMAPFIYSFAKQITNNAMFSLLVTCAVCFGTPLYKYSTLYYAHSLVGMFLFTAFFIWFCIRDEEQINLTKVLISGYLLGYAIITEYPTAIIAGCIGLYILYVLWKKKSLFDIKIYIRLMIGAIIPIILALTYNTAVFHHPFKTGYSYEVIPTFLEGQQGGLMGIGWPNLSSLFYMTFHSSMGVFWQSPVLLLAFLGWFRMWQNPRYRAEAILSFGVVVIYFLMMSGYFIWWGGSAFTPRNLIPAFPFFGIPLVFLFKKWERALMSILGVVSIAQMFVVAAANNEGMGPLAESMANASIQSMFQQNSMIYNVYVPNFLKQFLGLNLGMEVFHLTGFQSLIPLLVVEGCLLATFIGIVLMKNKAGLQRQAESLKNEG